MLISAKALEVWRLNDFGLGFGLLVLATRLSVLLVGGTSESVLLVGVESLRLELEFERKLLVLVKALASGLNDVSITFKVIETIDGDLEDLAVDWPGTERSDPKTGEIVGDRDSPSIWMDGLFRNMRFMLDEIS